MPKKPSALCSKSDLASIERVEKSRFDTTNQLFSIAKKEKARVESAVQKHIDALVKELKRQDKRLVSLRLKHAEELRVLENALARDKARWEEVFGNLSRARDDLEVIQKDTVGSIESVNEELVHE